MWRAIPLFPSVNTKYPSISQQDSCAQGRDLQAPTLDALQGFTVRMALKPLIHSGMTRLFGLTHVLLAHIVWQGRGTMKSGKTPQLSPLAVVTQHCMLNIVQVVSSAKPHRYQQRDQDHALLDLSVPKELPIRGQLRKVPLQSTSVQ
jgi:hypothetical protein